MKIAPGWGLGTVATAVPLANNCACVTVPSGSDTVVPIANWVPAVTVATPSGTSTTPGARLVDGDAKRVNVVETVWLPFESFAMA